MNPFKTPNGNSIPKEEKISPDNYIVRIYHREEGNGTIMGYVEDTNNAIEKPFHTYQEMLGLLKCCKSCERRRSKRAELFIPAKVKGINIRDEIFTEETILRDISPDGASFMVENLVSYDTVFQMQIYPAGSASMDVIAKVTRIDDCDDKQLVGVKIECL